MTHQSFALETILTCVSFYKIDNNIPTMVSYPTMWSFLSFAGNANPYEFASSAGLVVVTASICGYLLVKEHPGLGDVVYPYHGTTQPYELWPWLEEQYGVFGREMIVHPTGEIILDDTEQHELLRVNEVLKERFGLS